MLAALVLNSWTVVGMNNASFGLNMFDHFPAYWSLFIPLDPAVGRQFSSQLCSWNGTERNYYYY